MRRFHIISTHCGIVSGVNHRPPWIDEDFDEFPEVPDPLATRTLLVEHINDLVEANALEDIFRQFGVVDNIIVKYMRDWKGSHLHNYFLDAPTGVSMIGSVRPLVRNASAMCARHIH